MPTLADVLNAPTELEFEGTVYHLRQPTLMEQATYQRWLEKQATAAAGRMVDLSDAQQQKVLEGVAAKIGLGVYEFGGEFCMASLQTQSGLAKLVSIVLADQGVDEAKARLMLLGQLKEIAFSFVSKLTTDPKELAAALVALGLPPDYSSSSRTRPSTTESTTSEASPQTS